MSEKTPNALLQDIENFCAEFQIKPETLANRISYPMLIKRLRDGERVKPNTIENVYTGMELQRFKMEVKACNNIRQAVEVAHKFLRGRTDELT